MRGLGINLANLECRRWSIWSKYAGDEFLCKRRLAFNYNGNFKNYQWGAEKINTTLWYDNSFIDTELDQNLSYAKVADACGLRGCYS